MRAQAEGTPGISRRTFLGAGLTALVTVAFLDTLAASKAIPSSVEPILAGWLRRLHSARTAWRRHPSPCLAERSRGALLAGFEDQSHFTKVFRRAAGLMPTQYRAEL